MIGISSLFLSASALGAPAQELLKLVASDGAQEDYFGVSVAMSGNLAIAGARLDDDNGQQSGSVYVYNVATGIEMAKLLASDGAAMDRLGDFVALEGTKAIVSSQGDDDHGANSGSAYVFDVATSQQLHKLTASDGAAEDAFGSSVAMAGNLAIVGAFGDDDNGTNSGSAYVFDLTTGQQLVKLLPADGAASDFFGIAVGLSGRIAIVGAAGDDDNGASSGSAYLFDVITGQQFAKLTPTNAAPLDFFGKSVAIRDQRAVVGAGFAFSQTSDGAAYLFDVGSGQQLFQLTPSSVGSGASFGTSVAISDDRVLVGAGAAPVNGVPSGAAFEFDLASGLELGKLTASDPESGDQYGHSVALDGETAIVGAFLEDELGDQAGAAYLVALTGRLGGPDPNCVALPNSTGSPGALTGIGQLAVAQNDCTLTASNLPPMRTSLLLASRDSLFNPFLGGFSNGNGCIGGNIARFGQQVTGSNAIGNAEFSVDLTSIPLGTGAVAALPGDTWYFQVWHRDSAGPSGNNLTSSLCVTFQ